MTGYTEYLRAPDLPAEAPVSGSKWFPETGVVLRSTGDLDRETYLHLIAGSHHEHYDYDSGR